MCGIFGIIGRDNNFMSDLRVLASHATQRGRDSSGLMTFDKDYSVVRAEYSLSQLIKNVELPNNIRLSGNIIPNKISINSKPTIPKQDKKNRGNRNK